MDNGVNGGHKKQYKDFSYQGAQHFQKCHKSFEIRVILSGKIYKSPQDIIPVE